MGLLLLYRNTDLLQADVREIHGVLGAICHHLHLERPKPLLCGGSSGSSQMEASNASNHDHDEEDKDGVPGCEVSPPGTPSAVQAPIDTFLDITKLGSPRSAETPSQSRHNTTIVSQDLVSKGIISMADAETLVDRYFTRVDSYLYGIGSRLHNLHQLRTVHPILFAAICTVSALHDARSHRCMKRVIASSVVW